MAKRVLIVEDSREVIECLMLVLPRTNIYVVAETMDQAHVALTTQHYDLVVTDFQFPGGNGNKVAEAAKEKGFAVWLHTGDPENQEIQKDLFLQVFPKLSKDLVRQLAA